MELKEQKNIWDAIAPEWHEYKKHSSELAKEFLKNQTGKILDLGSGSGRHLTKIKKGKMYLLDFSEEMIKLAKQKSEQENIKMEGVVSEMIKIPYESNFFDGAISISSIHCTPKKQHKKIVQELYRVMKPKSKSLIGVWNINSKRFRNPKSNEKLVGWRDKGKRYYYLFNEEEIHNLFIETGFKITGTQNSEMMIRFIAEKR